METKFCTSCQCYRELEGGIKRKAGKIARWICKPCLEHKTESIYKNKSGKVADVRQIMAKLYAAKAVV